MITTHSLSADAFAELAGGAGDCLVVRQLHETQFSKHLMLLHVVAEAAVGVDRPIRAAAAFRAGYRLLVKAQAADPAVVAKLLGLPHVGGWAHDCLACLDDGSLPDFGYLAVVAVAAAVRLGIQFDIDVPVRDGRVRLPGLGCLESVGQGEWVRLSSDGKRLQVGEHIKLDCAILIPDDGSSESVPHWRGTPLVRSVTAGQAWEVLLEAADGQLDRYALPVLSPLSKAEATRWRQLIQAAWKLLVNHHQWAAAPIAAGVSVIVPLVSRTDLDSATSPAAFGAIATSLPPSPVSMAEMLIHEFQHIKLCGLMDMLPLVQSSAERGYAPWRDDPRPLGGILQGVYAFSGIVRFWDVQRRLETQPDDILRASVLYERWRLATELVTRTLLASDCLTPTGVRFVTMLRQCGQPGESPPVPAEAREMARETALDDWLSWQLRHTAIDAAGVARLAGAYQRGEPFGGLALPEAWIGNDIREVDSVLRSRLLASRYQEPQRYRQLAETETHALGEADALLVGGNASAAVAAYREALTGGPDPAAWIGLALAIHRLPFTSVRPVFAMRLPLLFEMHALLSRQGIHADAVDLATWFA